ncbi:exodeoxyribonuclease I [Aliivibrio fischeri]|uniref:exodeoxyribonuclease I n=1 Tax=Aliivibrio fischeri TaxID=668 RepID=UPI0018F13455|nr:exodeoxyribonuclease I [Aliivibrio fischeri]USR94455.1 exodeoxyribonuclease I [Aliivibrio fischeri ATCC 7744 = JCM 18803 = DSM 507]
MPQNNAPSFFFFDYETWGTSPSLDRPCQFAGVRTDEDFNIIGEPLVIYCRPPVDYLPSPEACLITGITPQTAVNKGLSEPEFIAKIHHELSQPNTCSLGYNNIRFDDEVSRYTLYRNFFEPYGWSWQNGNSRWDLLDVMRAVYALRPEGINWPKDEEGRPSFKLEKLSVANSIEHANAHDAMADVIATIELAKKVKQAQPKMFNYLLSMRNKKKAATLIDIVEMTPLMHVSGMFGVDRGNISWIVPVAWHPTNNNAVITIDLALDPSVFLELNVEELHQRMYTKRSELGPDELPVPVKLVHLNKCPVLAPAKTLTAENAANLNVDREACLRNLKVIRENPEIRQKLIELYSIEPNYEKSTNVDTLLYDGFFSHADKATIDIIRQSTPEQLIDFEPNVTDPRIKPLLFRYRARNFPHTLNEAEQLRWHAHLQDYFQTHLPDYEASFESLYLESEGNDKKVAILKAVYNYVQQLIS